MWLWPHSSPDRLQPVLLRPLLGLPQPSPNLGARGLKDTLGLVLDRDQGLLVQCPTVLFGLLGLWYSRRTTQVTNVVLVLGVLAILVINGTQPIATAFGGVALAGRFQWTVLPLLLAWSPFFLRRLEVYRRGSPASPSSWAPSGWSRAFRF